MVRKHTNGTWIQEFDDEGNLIRQYFKAGDDSFYETVECNLPNTEVVTNFYHPFDTSP